MASLRRQVKNHYTGGIAWFWCTSAKSESTLRNLIGICSIMSRRYRIKESYLALLIQTSVIGLRRIQPSVTVEASLPIYLKLLASSRHVTTIEWQQPLKALNPNMTLSSLVVSWLYNPSYRLKSTYRWCDCVHCGWTPCRCAFYVENTCE